MMIYFVLKMTLTEAEMGASIQSQLEHQADEEEEDDPELQGII